MVKANNDVVKFVMDHPAFAGELADQLQHLNAEIKWEASSDVITVQQKSAEIFVPKWSEECHSLVKKFFERFRKDTYTVQKDIQDPICNKLDEIKNSVSSFDADCWLASNNGILVLVSLKTNFVSVSKTVKDFLEDARVGSKKLKQIVKCVEVSSDHIDYLERVQFLDTVKQCHQGIVEATITKTRNEIRFVGTDKAILDAKQQYEDLVKELNIIRLQLPTEVIKFISKEAGLQFIDQCLGDHETAYVIVMEGKSSVKVISQSPKKCNEIKECISINVCEATISLTAKDEHVLSSKKWEEIFNTIQSEQLVGCQVVYGTLPGIKLHGAAHLVENYKQQVAGFIKAQKIESRRMPFTSGVVRFIQEKSCSKIGRIKDDLEDEHVKIEMKGTKCILKGTKKGIHEGEKRILALSGEITSRSVKYSSVGVTNLIFSEDGKLSIKGIEAGTNTIVEVCKGLTTMKKESTHEEVEAMRVERGKKQVTANPRDLFDQCSFTTSKGVNVSWKYGNIAEQQVSKLFNVNCFVNFQYFLQYSRSL